MLLFSAAPGDWAQTPAAQLNARGSDAVPTERMDLSSMLLFARHARGIERAKHNTIATCGDGLLRAIIACNSAWRDSLLTETKTDEKKRQGARVRSDRRQGPGPRPPLASAAPGAG